MATSLDTVKMLEELAQAGVTLNLNDQPDLECCYNYIIHQYDITFLATRWEFVSESRSHRVPGTRIGSGPYKGKFPGKSPKEK